MKWSVGGSPTNSRHSIGSLKRSSAQPNPSFRFQAALPSIKRQPENPILSISVSLRKPSPNSTQRNPHAKLRYPNRPRSPLHPQIQTASHRHRHPAQPAISGASRVVVQLYANRQHHPRNRPRHPRPNSPHLRRRRQRRAKLCGNRARVHRVLRRHHALCPLRPRCPTRLDGSVNDWRGGRGHFCAKRAARRRKHRAGRRIYRQHPQRFSPRGRTVGLPTRRGADCGATPTKSR